MLTLANVKIEEFQSASLDLDILPYEKYLSQTSQEASLEPDSQTPTLFLSDAADSPFGYRIITIPKDIELGREGSIVLSGNHETAGIIIDFSIAD